MSTVAVTGANSPVGRALVARLDAARSVTRVVAVDLDEPDMPAAKLEFRTADVRDPLLPNALAGADVVVNLAGRAGSTRDEDTMFARTVNGTRNMLAAAAKVGATKVVHLSSAAIYGAHPDNLVPLPESAPLRANPDFGYGYQQLLAEELVAEWAAGHPDATVTVLRPAPMLGPGVDGFLARQLECLRLPLVRGHAPPRQFVHVEDVAAALALAVTADLPGPYNVAADGWLAAEELLGLLGRKPVVVPEAVAFTTAEQLWARGLSELPAGAVHYVMHPVVLDTDRLHEQGWAPTRSNREIIREFADAHRPYLTLGRVRLRRRQLGFGLVAILALLGGLLTFRRSRRSL
ncbi:MAG TPA: NAD-dependent epimerase/dehydratase family protein [Egibacteraceae bacterium]|nr:NAD-dependent epimerase/dehydratase family protein [Egibacteraceae bacterium]